MSLDVNEMQRTLLEIIEQRTAPGGGSLQTNSVLTEARRKLGIKLLEEQQALLVFWNDLFRNGYLAWGYDINNPEPPFCHVTKRGREALKHFSRDPLNADGYIAYIDSCGNINPVARSYIEEAAAAYRANCYKATVILVGGASESIILEIRDRLVAKINASNLKPHSDLTSWQIKKVADGVLKDIEAYKVPIGHSLYESITGNWSTMVSQLRQTRNDAGHPINPSAATQDTAHGTLLIFPEVVRSAYELIEWIDNHR